MTKSVEVPLHEQASSEISAPPAELRAVILLSPYRQEVHMYTREQL